MPYQGIQDLTVRLLLCYCWEGNNKLTEGQTRESVAVQYSAVFTVKYYSRVNREKKSSEFVHLKTYDVQQ